MELEYFLVVDFPHHHGDIVSCSNEISAYVRDHSNWVQPILPGGGSCPDTEFNPAYFDSLSNRWTCSVQKEKDGKYTIIQHNKYIL